MIRIAFAALLTLAVLSGCGGRRNDGMDDYWKGVGHVMNKD